MSKIVRCYVCGKQKWMHDKHYKMHSATLKVENLVEFNNKYKCQKCRKLTKPNGLRETKEFKDLQLTLQDVFNEAIKRDMNKPETRKNLQESVDNIFHKKFITNYSLFVEGVKIKGIVLKQLPFYGDMLIELKL